MLLEEDGETKCVDREECPSEVEECPEGKIYKECGTACPLTCENKDDDIICTKQCVPGKKAKSPLLTVSGVYETPITNCLKFCNFTFA